MATHSSVLAWRIPWIEEPGGLQSMGFHRVGHNLGTKPPSPCWSCQGQQGVLAARLQLSSTAVPTAQMSSWRQRRITVLFPKSHSYSTQDSCDLSQLGPPHSPASLVPVSSHLLYVLFSRIKCISTPLLFLPRGSHTEKHICTLDLSI